MTMGDQDNPFSKFAPELGSDEDWLGELGDAFDDFNIEDVDKASHVSNAGALDVAVTQQFVPGADDDESDQEDAGVEIDLEGFDSLPPAAPSAQGAPETSKPSSDADVPLHVNDNDVVDRLNALVTGLSAQSNDAFAKAGDSSDDSEILPEHLLAMNESDTEEVKYLLAHADTQSDEIRSIPQIGKVSRSGETHVDPSHPSGTEAIEGHHAIRTQTLDISELQKRLGGIPARTPSGELGDILKDDQLWQFISLILMRLFDDLELLLIQKHCDEACDLVKQFNRLANIVSFAGLGEQLPLLAYIGNLLPISFTEVDIGVESERRFDAMKMRHFLDHSNEILNCMIYLLTYLSKRAPHFDTSRFTATLTELYDKLGLKPGQPSIDAPLPVVDSINPQELTSRTINKLARTLEALTTESLHYIESAINYGYGSGYSDASRSMNNAAQIAREYKLSALESLFAKLYFELHRMHLPTRPEREMFDTYLKVCDLFELHFAHSIIEKKLKHLRALVNKFYNEITGATVVEGFSSHWKTFIKDAAPILDFEHASLAELRDKLHILKEKAHDNSIRWLETTFTKLDNYWPTYSESCAEAFINLCSELRAFPTEEIEEKDIEQLNHERIQVLFDRKLDERPASPYSIIKSAASFVETILQQVNTPSAISSRYIQKLLIDARQINCHALVRCCEILLSLLERVPAPEGDEPVVVAQSVVTALYFTAGLMQAICERLMRYLELDQHTTAVSFDQVFYAVLLSLYSSPGQPSDSLIGYITRRINAILTELQLVWVNAATPTSTEYYCGLIRQLLHLATMCEMNDVRHMIINHLDDVPQADFINTGNATMQHKCMRIIRAIEDACPQQALMPSSNQMRLFFSKTIAALNQLLSSRDANDPDMLGAEIARIWSRMSMIGMTTDFPPVIAIIYELHHMAFNGNINRTYVEDLLYQMINVANNVCPEWIQPREGEFEFIKTPMQIPMMTFQDMYESVRVLHDTLQTHASEEPIAWEHIKSLYKTMHSMVNYAPTSLQSVVQNAQNRCRYLKKNIYIELVTDDYPPESELPTDAVRSAVSVVFSAIMEQLIQVIVDNAFTSTDYNSRISIVLHPFPMEFTASIFHNGKLFTYEEILERLAKVNIMPARDEHVFELLVGSRRLALSYPPVNTIAYILPIVRQFDGELDISNDGQGNTRFYLSFKL